MKKAGRKLWSAGWRIAVAAILLAWIFNAIFVTESRSAWEAQGLSWEELPRLERSQIAWTHGPQALWKTLNLLPPGTFIVSVALLGLTVLIGIIRWHLILRAQDFDLPLRRTASISFVALFFNSFLLGSTGGDLMKAYYVARETHHKKLEAVTTVFVDRLIGLWTMLGFAVALMLPNWRLIAAEERIAAACGLVALIFAALTAFCLLMFRGGVSKTWPQARHWLRRLPKGETLDRLLESCRQFGRSRLLFARSIVLSMILNAVLALHVIVLASGLGIDIPPEPLLLLVPIIIFLSAMPITPSGLGVRENLYVFMLAAPALGVPATPALSLSLVAYAGILLWSLAGGLVYLGIRGREHLNEVEGDEPSGQQF